MGSNIQKRVSDTILQKPTVIVLAGRRYRVAPPTIATLVLVSGALGQMPDISLDKGDIMGSVLRNAKDCARVADICAVLILGARKAGRRRFGFGKTEAERLSKRLSERVQPKELSSAVSAIMAGMQIGDFFVLTTFLQGLNTTKPTKVVTDPTASGL